MKSDNSTVLCFSSKSLCTSMALHQQGTVASMLCQHHAFSYS